MSFYQGGVGGYPFSILGGMLDVGSRMVAAASALGVPGFGMALPAVPFLANGLGYGGGRSPYWGSPAFRGVADLASLASDIGRGFPMGIGLGFWGGGGPMWGGEYFLGTGPFSLLIHPLFYYLWNQMFGASAGPAASGTVAPSSPPPSVASAAHSYPTDSGSVGDDDEGEEADETEAAPPAAATAATSAATAEEKKEEEAPKKAGGERTGRRRGVGGAAGAGQLSEIEKREINSLVTELQESGWDLTKMDRHQAERLAQYVQKYPFLQEAIEKLATEAAPAEGADTEGGYTEPPSDEEIGWRRRRLAELNELSGMMTLSPEEEAERRRLQNDPMLK